MSKKATKLSTETKTIDAETDSGLDETTAKYFYFKSKDSDVVYKISVETAKLSDLFATMIEQHKTGCDTYENAIPLEIIRQKYEHNNDSFIINNDRMLSYVNEYFKIWADNPDGATYIKEGPIQTSDIKNILNIKDLELIRTYLHDSIKLINEGKLSGYTDFSMDKFLQDDIYNHFIKNQLLYELLSQVDGFLSITSFANKIFAYIVHDIEYISAINAHDGKLKFDSYFAKLQNQESHKGIVGDTTGDCNGDGEISSDNLPDLDGVD